MLAKQKRKSKPARITRRFYPRRRRIPVCGQIKAIGRTMRKAIAEHVKACKRCQNRAHENMTNNMIEVAVFSCDE